MNNFTFYSPTKFIFGHGVVDKVGENLAAAGHRNILIVYGKGSVIRNGTLERVKKSLDDAKVMYCELGGVRPNPEIESVREGIEIARSEGIDLILAVGGGSVMDCSKAIAVGIFYEGDVWDFFSKKLFIEDALPLASVLTIPAAGSEASSSCVISNDEVGRKCGIGSDKIRPCMAFMEPELTYTLPAYQTAAGVTDMIAHIMERYFSGVGTVEVTDHIAIGLVKSIMACARKVTQNPQDYDARAGIMWAGTLAHNDLAGIGRGIGGGRDGDWASHALEHELSAFDTSITHGAGLAVIMPAWMRYVWPEDPSRFLEFARDLFGIVPVDDTEDAQKEAILSAIDELQAFFASMGMPTKLGEFDIKPEDVDSLLPTLKLNKGDVFGSFKVLHADDARAIYLSAF